MADSDALRQRRSRAHRRGDHSLCRPQHCRQAPPLRPVELADTVRQYEGTGLGDALIVVAKAIDRCDSNARLAVLIGEFRKTLELVKRG